MYGPIQYKLVLDDSGGLRVRSLALDASGCVQAFAHFSLVWPFEGDWNYNSTYPYAYLVSIRNDAYKGLGTAVFARGVNYLRSKGYIPVSRAYAVDPISGQRLPRRSVKADQMHARLAAYHVTFETNLHGVQTVLTAYLDKLPQELETWKPR